MELSGYFAYFYIGERSEMNVRCFGLFIQFNKNIIYKIDKLLENNENG